MALTNDDFATLEVHLAVFHDIPERTRQEGEAPPPAPVLSEAETPLTNFSRAYIRNKLVETLKSTKSYPTKIRDDGGRVVESVIEFLRRQRQEPADFVIQTAMKRKVLYTERHIKIIVPAEHDRLVAVGNNRGGSRRAILSGK